MKKLFVALFFFLLTVHASPIFSQDSTLYDGPVSGYEVEIVPMDNMRSGGGGDSHVVNDYHRVQPRQTLFGISKLYRTSVANLRSLNKLKGNTIYVGQRLLIRRRTVALSGSSNLAQIGGSQAYNRPNQYESKPVRRPQNTYQNQGSQSYSHEYNRKPVKRPQHSYAGQGSSSYSSSYGRPSLPSDNSYQVSPHNNSILFKRRFEEYWGYHKPSLRSVHIGVSEFKDWSIPQLPYARNDAYQMERMLKKQQGATFSKVDSRLLLGKNTTRQNIKFTIETQSAIAKRNDLLVMSISGHAIKKNGELHILPYDYYQGYRNSITARDIIQYLSGTDAKILLILDVCYSGHAGYDFGRYIPKGMDISVMVSSRDAEKSAENQSWKHGAFTRAFLEGINSAADINQDRIVSLSELIMYTQARVRSMTHQAQHANCPINFLGDAPLFRY